MDFVQTERPPGDAYCSQDDCPCGNSRIPRYTGYLYIDQEFIDSHREEVVGDIVEPGGEPIPGMPQILLCERAAELKQLDLEVAAADARYWWMTGLAPLRVTPTATPPES